MSSYSDVLSTGITKYGVIAVVVTTVLTVLATILAAMRFMLRRKVGLGIDDYLLMVVLVFLTIQLIIQYLSELIPAFSTVSGIPNPKTEIVIFTVFEQKFPRWLLSLGKWPSWPLKVPLWSI